MRTDTRRLTPLLLVAALLAGGPPGLSAQEKPDAQRIRERAAALEEARRQLDSARAEMTRELATIEEEMEREMAEAQRESVQAGEAGVSVRTGNQVVPRGEVVEGDLVVHDGDLRIEGEVRGNVVVTGGDLSIGREGAVLGDAKVIGGSLNNDGGRVMGEMLTIRDEGPRRPRAAAPPSLPEGPRHAQASRSRDGWFGRIAETISDLFATIMLALVVAGIGAALVFYGLPKLRTVSETLRSSTGRAAAVGVAATVLILPVFALGVLALTISIVGIPLLLVAVPLYPVLVMAAFAFGLFASLHAIGEKTVEQRSELGYRHRNAYSYLFIGTGILAAPLLLAAVADMVPFLEWLSVLLRILSVVAVWAVATVGLGAVILSRAGTQKVFVPRDFDPVLDEDPLFDSEPVAR